MFFDRFCKDIFYLAVHGAEIIFRPAGNFFPKGRRKPKQKLFFILIRQRLPPPFISILISVNRAGVYNWLGVIVAAEHNQKV